MKLPQLLYFRRQEKRALMENSALYLYVLVKSKKCDAEYRNSAIQNTSDCPSYIGNQVYQDHLFRKRLHKTIY
jgi:hypothetical protein